MIKESVELGYLIDITKLVSSNLQWLKYSDFYITPSALNEIKAINEVEDTSSVKVVLEDIVDMIRVQRDLYSEFIETQNVKSKINPYINLYGNYLKEYTVTMVFAENKFNIIINNII